MSKVNNSAAIEEMENTLEKKIVITGVNGFVGEHVTNEFRSNGYAVIGVGHEPKANPKVSSKITEYISCNLLDEEQVSEKLNLTNVSALIHLAGLAMIGQSFEQPKRFMTDNGIMTHNILQVALRDKMPGRAVVVSTGALYGADQPLPLTEESKTSAISPYAVGKLFAEEIVHYYANRGVNAVVARPFNHIGPGQAPGFILPDMYDQLMESKASGVMKVGNIETKRDYTDVRDVARAYAKLALASTLKYGTYNICSGTSITGKEILSVLQEAANTHDIKIEVDQSRIRPTDVMDIFGDASRLREELNWQPEIPVEQSIKDFVASRV